MIEQLIGAGLEPLRHAHHQDAPSVKARGDLSGEAPAKLRLVSSDETNDLALLQVTGSFKDVAKIKDKAIQSGDSVVAIGYPFRTAHLRFHGHDGNRELAQRHLNDTRESARPFQPNNGGPLLASSSDVGGVVAAKLNALKFKGDQQHSGKHQFRHQDGSAAGFLDNGVVPADSTQAEMKTADIARSPGIHL
jgi:hypothetical protein